MVKHSESHLDATFGALSDATRRAILARLADGEASVSELAAPYRMSLPAVSKHLRVLEGAPPDRPAQARPRVSLPLGGAAHAQAPPNGWRGTGDFGRPNSTPCPPISKRPQIRRM
jgi:hypothetical protein